MSEAAGDHGISAIDRLLAGAVADGVAPGLTGAVADGAGVLHRSSCGVLAAGGDRAMTGETIFWLASMTKLVTTIAAMQLVEVGALQLDMAVAALLPELADPQVLIGLDDAGNAITRPAMGAITLRHLLTHRSGIGYELMNPALLAARGPGGPPPATSRASLHGPLAADPGTRWTYGYGIDWVGIAVERQSGLTLDRYFAERIFDPLGMRDTGFAVAADAGARVAFTHLRGAGGSTSIVPSPAGDPAAWEFHSGGAGLFGTATDYIRLLRMLLRGGELDGARILRRETVAAMWDEQPGAGPAGRLDTAHPALVLPYDPLPGQDGGWSLIGVRNAIAIDRARRAGSASWAGVAGTFFWIDREADLCGVLLAQLMPFADPALAAIQRGFERAAYAGAAAGRRQQSRNAA